MNATNLTPLIQKRIREIQQGRSGIYPHHVGRDIAAEFTIPLAQATQEVLAHIQGEIDRIIEEGNCHVEV